MPNIDPRIFGGTIPNYDGGGNTAVTATMPMPKPVPIGTAVEGLSTQEARGAQAMAEATRPETSTMAAVKAGWNETIGMKIYNGLSAPDFAADPKYDAVGRLAKMPFSVSKQEAEYLLTRTNSDASFDFHTEAMKEQRAHAEALGDHPMIGLGMLAADPGFLALSMVSGGTFGAARLAQAAGAASKMQRAVAFGTSASIAGFSEVMQDRVTPVSREHILGTALLFGAAEGLLFKPGKGLVKADRHFPTADLNRLADEVADVGKGSGERAALKAEVEAASTRVVTKDAVEATPFKVGADVPETITKLARKPTFAYEASSGRAMLEGIAGGTDAQASSLARKLLEFTLDDVEVRTTSKKNLIEGSRAFYDPAQHAVYLGPASEDWIKLHELTHALTNTKMRYGMANPMTAHGLIAAEIDGLRLEAKKAFDKLGKDAQAHNTKYYLSNNDEFMAGLFSLDKHFNDLLSGIKQVHPDRVSASLLSRVVDTVRRLLGIGPQELTSLTKAMGLTEQLMKERLNVTTFNREVSSKGVGFQSGSFSYRAAPPNVAKALFGSKGGRTLEWSMSGKMQSFGEVGKKVAAIVFDDPLAKGGNAAASLKRAIHADLQGLAYKYSDAVRDHMSSTGWGLWQRMVSPRKAYRAQREVEDSVAMEMLRRDDLTSRGITVTHTGVPEHVKTMADHLDVAYARALKERQVAGVFGSAEVKEASGYFQRKWDISKFERAEAKMVADGMTPAAAKLQMHDLISVAIQRANGWDASVSSDIARAIYSRAKDKGYFADSAFKHGLNSDGVKELKSLLTDSGIVGKRADAVLEKLAGVVDEAGKAPSLKHRIRMAMDESITHSDGSTSSLSGMIDTNMGSLVDRYMDTASAEAAFAKLGYTKQSDLLKLRSELLESIPDMATREQAAELFDDGIKMLRGEPVGEKMNVYMRNLAAYTQSIGLANSGVFQVTEYATIMAHYGMMGTMREVFRELPVFKQILGNADDAGHLSSVLATNAAQDTRLQPFLTRMEDGFEIAPTEGMQLFMQQAKQLVPYANGMKFIQKHQAKVVGNLITSVFARAAKGDAKALATLEHYGLQGHVMQGIENELAVAGMDTTKWSASTWDAVRGPLTKMVDESVLRMRVGEMPHFAVASATGKFIFSFRSFVLGAHNKVLASTLHNSGAAGLALMLTYQLPMTYAATATLDTINKRPEKTQTQMVAAAWAQAGSMGLLGELASWAFGLKQSVGAPGLIGADKLVSAVGAVGQATGLSSALNGGPKEPAKWGAIAHQATTDIPAVSTFLPLKWLGATFKEMDE